MNNDMTARRSHKAGTADAPTKLSGGSGKARHGATSPAELPIFSLEVI